MSRMMEPITMPAITPGERPEGLLADDEPDEDDSSEADFVKT